MSKNILVIQTAFIGDAILCTALLEQINKSFPEAKIDLMVRRGNESLFTDHPFLQKVYVWDKSRKYKSLYANYKALKKNQYDSIINLQRFGATGLLTWFLKSGEKIGFDKNPFSFAYHRKVKHEIQNGIHETERNASLIAHWDGVEPVQKPRLYPQEAHKNEVGSYMGEAFVTMSPASVWATKQLPEEKWIELADKQPDSLKIYLLGGSSDNLLCERIKSKTQHKNVINLCGKTSLLASAALMEAAQMNFVNDSAPLHLASSMNARVTVFYCSTIPGFGFGPLSSDSMIIETAEKISCRPCGLHGKRKCPENHFKCGKGIQIPTQSV